MESVSKRFEKIYSNGFRHRYSEIACMIGEITENPSQDNHESLDSLGVNLQVLEEYIRTHIEYDDEVYRGVYKLRDHVNLEMQRMEKQNTLSREHVKAEEEIIRIKTETEAELKTMTEAVKKAEGIQLQMVAILGIFAAIVMAFSGGMDMLSGSLSVANDSNIFNVIFIVLLCGILMFNIFAFLMHIIVLIVRPPRNHLSNTTYGKEKKGLKQKISNGIENMVGGGFVVFFNTILIIAMGLDIACMILL